MEERGSTVAATDDPPLVNNLAIQLSSASGHRLETYVVQVPKDQIYRVPPPENARIVEEHRNRLPSPTKKTPWRKYLLWAAIILVVIGVIVGVSLTALYLSFTPKSPAFSITQLTVKNSSDDGPPKYNLALKVQNTNEKLGVQYGSTDEASLIYWKQTLATGSFPAMHQDAGNSTVIHLTLLGAEGRLPRDVEKSIGDKKPSHQISLGLKFNSPLVMNNWVLRMWTRNMDVTCTFRVSMMGAGSKVLSQNCQTKLS
ncbi:hypothetical protein SLEP1_g34806 [Rubroshorea leprosula]|uniref:Late embryogenesis abundant protein LEA-2 subgroup domain-containing protein n=1 Tax=Rubroshorea leprosula TaxID=152421 RepID=A0AAV5KLF5_9ROSI|nr:hypothetical protein SLEP1_g34806 [Rubroshorea leprosula]